MRSINVLGHMTMKKMVLVFATVIAMVASVTVLANSCKDGSFVRNHEALFIHVAVQGKHCSGTVGCSCSGFSPITNGDIWEEAYCRRCSHHRRFHR